MGSFKQLISVVVEHAYFEPRRCQALQFSATAETAAALRSTGCMLRPIAAGFEVCHDQDAAAALRLQLEQTRPWPLRFLATSTDPQFANYTDGVDGGPLELEGREAGQLQATQGNAAPSGWQGNRMPMYAVTLQIESNVLERAPLLYRLQLAARATRWKYYLLGEWPAQGLRIVDAAGLLQFDTARAEQLPDGRTAQVIVSNTAITLQERPQQRLALRSADRVLVKRLPVPSPGRLAREAHAPGWISEIYVTS